MLTIKSKHLELFKLDHILKLLLIGCGIALAKTLFLVTNFGLHVLLRDSIFVSLRQQAYKILLAGLVFLFLRFFYKKYTSFLVLGVSLLLTAFLLFAPELSKNIQQSVSWFILPLGVLVLFRKFLKARSKTLGSICISAALISLGAFSLVAGYSAFALSTPAWQLKNASNYDKQTLQILENGRQNTIRQTVKTASLGLLSDFIVFFCLLFLLTQTDPLAKQTKSYLNFK